MTPTARSLKFLRDRGYTAGVVERYIAATRRKVDFFGCFDLVSAHPAEGYILAVQTTTFSNLSSRVTKVLESAEALAWAKAGGRIEVHGWKKVGNRWRVLVVAVELTSVGTLAKAPPVDGRALAV